MIGATFIVAPIDENRGAPGAPPGIHVAPPIADHEAVGQRLRHARQDLQRGLGGRRERPAVTDDWTIDYAVPVEEDGAPNASVDSHFVCAALSAGCDTRRCHTTAWNASECGVMLSAFTVGTMTHASATCAV